MCQCLPRGWGFPSGSSVESTTINPGKIVCVATKAKPAEALVEQTPLTVVASTSDYHPSTITHSLDPSHHHVQMQRFRVGSK